LGFPLAVALMQTGYTVKGSTTSEHKLPLLSEKGIEAFLVDLGTEAGIASLPTFLESPILILNIPPRTRANGGAAYLEQIRVLLKALQASPVEKIIFVSSTSVIPDLNRIVTEEDLPPISEETPSNPLLWSEYLFKGSRSWQTTIVRFGGLIGGNRHPGRFLAGKTDVPNPDSPVNLIHLHDCIRILLEVLNQNRWNTDYLACADEHPNRLEFYTRAAHIAGLTPPQFRESDPATSSFKIVCNRKLKEELNFTFSYPDPYMMISSQVPSEV
jgi:nucleoside-diphosphate-sugar epimerase